VKIIALLDKTATFGSNMDKPSHWVKFFKLHF